MRTELRALSRRFADDLLATLDRYGIWDERGRWRVAGEPDDSAAGAQQRATRKRLRRTTTALDKVTDRILAVLQPLRQPVAISAIAAELDTSPRQIAHPIALLVEQGTVIKTGQRRGTRYRLAAGRKRAAARRKATRR